MTPKPPTSRVLSPAILDCAARLCAFGLPGPSPLQAGEDAWKAETPAARDARMARWREARSGMFIHRGPIMTVPSEAPSVMRPVVVLDLEGKVEVR